MKNVALIGIKAFLFFAISFTVIFGVTFTIYYGEFIIPFKYGTMVGLFMGFFGALLTMLGRLLFVQRVLFYRNIDTELNARGVKNVIFGENAVNTTFRRIQYGGLFLSDGAVLFLPGRFAWKPRFINLPLKKIKQVGKARINPLKFFSGGFSNRLYIETIEGERYEFLVWELNKWIEKIKKVKNQVE